MDPQRMKEAYERLQLLDERYASRLPRRERNLMHRPGLEQIEEQMKHLTSYTFELRDILEELFLSFASAPRPPRPPAPETV
ncbi:MAG TPA: hypothetical protein PK413_04180 [Thermoanaerobaculia bacterium]|nr:hypothetical protein [Thermoanaerobaculia bacterium]